MISLGGLLLIDDEVFKSIAIGSISVVLISVFGSLTSCRPRCRFLDRKVTRLGIRSFPRPRRGTRHPGARSYAWPRTRRRRGNGRGGDPHPGRVAGLQAPTRLHNKRRHHAAHSVEGVRAWELISNKWPQGRNLMIEDRRHQARQPETDSAIQALRGRSAGRSEGRQRLHDRHRLFRRRHRRGRPRGIPGGPNDIANWVWRAASGLPWSRSTSGR